MPSFVLDSDNLDNYRPWLRRAREWARKQGGDIMEQHLIGQIVPAGELTDEAIATADVQVIGHTADEGVGTEGGRRRQIRNPELMQDAEDAARQYAQAGLSALPVATQIAMTTAQITRYNSVQTQSAAWTQREDTLCDALNNILDAPVCRRVAGQVLATAAHRFNVQQINKSAVIQDQGNYELFMNYQSFVIVMYLFVCGL